MTRKSCPLQSKNEGTDDGGGDVEEGEKISHEGARNIMEIAIK